MVQRSLRSGDSERLWLSALIDTMERVSRPEVRAVPCDRRLLAAVEVQLARPVSPIPLGETPFGRILFRECCTRLICGCKVGTGS
jgi:hypothetical protein